MRVCAKCERLVGDGFPTCPDDGGVTVEVDEQPPAGARVGQYELVRPLGEGGMGFVYEAVHTVLGRRAAIKFLRTEYVQHVGIVTRFLQEARAVNRIDHDGIIDIYDYGDGQDGVVYFVMEFLVGQTLSDYEDNTRPIPLPTLYSIYRQIMSALMAAHAKKIVHRDLKPDNVFLIERAGNPHFVKILDFGVAKVRGEGAVPGLTKAGTVLGTPEYMSPEQIGGKESDERSDVYALGAMMYEAVVGRVPFEAEGFGRLAALVLTAPLSPPSLLAPDADIPAGLEALIVRALEKDAGNRFQSVLEMRDALDALDIGEPAQQGRAVRIPATGPLPVVPAPVTPAAALAGPGKGRWLVGAAVAAAAAIAVVVVLVAGGGDDDGGGDTAGSGPAPAAVDASAAPSTTIASLWAAGDKAAVRERAKAELSALLADDDPAVSRKAAAGLAIAAHPRVLDLLHRELTQSPQRRSQAAAALAKLGLPDSAPQVRKALDRSGKRLRVELAAALVALGDPDGAAILRKALGGDRVAAMHAAEALARHTDDPAALAYIKDVLATTPAGRPRWRRAVAVLGVRDDGGEANKLLRAELTQSDPGRSLAAARALARAGDAGAIAFLERKAMDSAFAGRGRAALELARTGGERALSYVKDGLAAGDALDRARAAAVVASLADKGAAAYGEAVAKLAADPDVTARAAALAALLAL